MPITNNNSTMVLPEQAEHAPPHHRKDHSRGNSISSIEDFTMLEIPTVEQVTEEEQVIPVSSHPTEGDVLPVSGMIVLTETSYIQDEEHEVIQSVAEMEFEGVVDDGKFRCYNWKGERFYSDYIQQGLRYLKKEADVVMLFESPSSSTTESTFHNKSQYKFHDWPPPKSTKSKSILGPCRYSLMNGSAFPTFLRGGVPPEGLVDHWKDVVPGFVAPTFCDRISEDQTAYAYLPVEQIKHHVNDPHTHYHLAGKDAIHLMTQKTTRLLPDTRTSRPCVVKTTHSMGSKGIFIIQDDEDEAEFEDFLEKSGQPTFVVTDFVDIDRNVACHFFMHPNGSIVWFGSNENHRDEDGKFSSDSYLLMDHQETLKEMQLPFVEEVVQYCKNLGFWGFCGVDVLFNSKGEGFLVDINPRVTGSCPALMTLALLKKKYGFSVGLFRRSGDTCYFGSSEELFASVKAYNTEHPNISQIVVHSCFQPDGKDHLRINIGVYGTDLDDCKKVLNTYAKPAPEDHE